MKVDFIFQNVSTLFNKAPLSIIYLQFMSQFSSKPIEYGLLKIGCGRIIFWRKNRTRFCGNNPGSKNHGRSSSQTILGISNQNGRNGNTQFKSQTEGSRFKRLDGILGFIGFSFRKNKKRTSFAQIFAHVGKRFLPTGWTAAIDGQGDPTIEISKNRRFG